MLSLVRACGKQPFRYMMRLIVENDSILVIVIRGFAIFFFEINTSNATTHQIHEIIIYYYFHEVCLTTLSNCLDVKKISAFRYDIRSKLTCITRLRILHGGKTVTENLILKHTVVEY